MEKIKSEIEDLKEICIDLVVKGKYNNVINYYKKILELNKGLEDSFIEAVFYNNLGNAYKKIGENDKAIRSYRKIVYISENLDEMKDKFLLIAYCGLGDVHSIKGNLDEANLYYDKALKLSENIKEIGLKFQVYNCIGLLHFDMGEMEKGIIWLRDAYKLLEENSLIDTLKAKGIKKNIEKAEEYMNLI